jgi:hypothetical protein
MKSLISQKRGGCHGGGVKPMAGVKIYSVGRKA